MPPKDEFTDCDFCRKQQVTWRTEPIVFRQWSDKGYVHCRAEVAVGICQSCGSRSLQRGSDEVLDAAFRKEYRKLR